ncbi:MAG: hypothetical protein ABI472_18005 [Ginsengibacter sp.]
MQSKLALKFYYSRKAEKINLGINENVPFFKKANHRFPRSRSFPNGVSFQLSMSGELDMSLPMNEKGIVLAIILLVLGK